MTKITGIAEAALYVDDLEKAKRFYIDVLGLPLTAQFGDSCFLQTGEHSTLILFQLSSLATRESVIPGHGAKGQGHVALAIPPEQMSAWRDRLQSHDIEIEHEQTWSSGTHSIYFRDPDENSIELIEATHYPLSWQKLRAAKKRTENSKNA